MAFHECCEFAIYRWLFYHLHDIRRQGRLSSHLIHLQGERDDRTQPLMLIGKIDVKRWTCIIHVTGHETTQERIPCAQSPMILPHTHSSAVLWDVRVDYVPMFRSIFASPLSRASSVCCAGRCDGNHICLQQACLMVWTVQVRTLGTGSGASNQQQGVAGLKVCLTRATWIMFLTG